MSRQIKMKEESEIKIFILTLKLLENNSSCWNFLKELIEVQKSSTDRLTIDLDIPIGDPHIY